MAETKTNQEHGTTTGGNNPGTTPNRTSTTAGQAGFSGASTQTGGQGGQGATGNATQRAQSGHQQSSAQQNEQQGSTWEQGQQMLDQAKQAVTDAYDRTSKTVNETYHQAMDYGRQNPGTMTLIAFGAGIGIGILMAGGFSSSRSRTSRIVPPVMNALTEVACELFR